MSNHQQESSRWQTGTTIVLAALISMLALRCVTGEVNTYEEGGGCPEGCPEDLTCVAGECIDPSTGCEDVRCPPGQYCVAGGCVIDDPCADIRCDPGEVCQNGLCVSEAMDDDGDGYVAASDCDDGDPDIHPGAVETCDGVDQNCNDAIDEGFDVDRDGYTSCGSGAPVEADCHDDDPNIHPNAEEACNAIDDDCDDDIDEELATEPCTSACGEGVQTCVEGRWECSAPETCECTPPGDEETEECGRCGNRSRSCGDDFTWGPWSGCGGEGTCERGEVQREDCERCGQRSRTCGDDCRWGNWSDCEGRGECSPGDTTDGGCDRCLYKRCNDDCRWGGCQLRPGSECEWREGRHWRCCGGGGRWQYCLPSCVWSSDCEDCSGCC